MMEVYLMEKEMNQAKKLIGIDELAEALNMPRSWVYEQSRRAKETGFPMRKFGKYLRFDLEEVMEWGEKK